jgi:hypothetical protein
MLETILLGGGNTDIDIAGLKGAVKKVSPQPKEDKDFDHVEAELLKKYSVQPAEAPVAGQTGAPGQPPAAASGDQAGQQKIDVKDDQDKSKAGDGQPAAPPKDQAAKKSDDKPAEPAPEQPSDKPAETPAEKPNEAEAKTEEKPEEQAAVQPETPEAKQAEEKPSIPLLKVSLRRHKKAQSAPAPVAPDPNKPRIKPVAMRKPKAKKKEKTRAR